MGRGRRRTVAYRSRGRGSWPSPNRGRSWSWPWVVAVAEPWPTVVVALGHGRWRGRGRGRSALNALGPKRGNGPKTKIRVGVSDFRASAFPRLMPIALNAETVAMAVVVAVTESWPTMDAS